MIDYSQNYENIIRLAEDYFSLEEETLKRFKENVKIGSVADPEILERLNSSFRVEKNLSIDEIEALDESWQFFKFHFGEYCVDTGITYSEYLFGNRTNQKNVSKISKDLKRYYKTENTVFSKRNRVDDVDWILSNINNFRLPRKKLKLVVSFNISDMFMSSSGQEWTSCLNLNSDYFGSYWYGLSSLPFDKNRGMIYLTYQKENSTQSFGITSEKMYKRSFFLLDERNHFNILRWYPNEFETNKYLDALNSIFPFRFKQINHSFVSKHPVDLPKVKAKGGREIEFYIYQDKTEINYIDKKMYFTGGKCNQYFTNGDSHFGQFINCEGGLSKMVSEELDVYHFISKTFRCERCEEIFSENDRYEIEGQVICRHCYDENVMYCERCGNEVMANNFNFDHDMCDECFSETEEVV